MIRKNCEFCGKEFETKDKRKRFCNIQCANKSRQKNPTEHTCKQCGKQFHRILREDDSCQFCSRECSDEYKRNNTNRYCKSCGKELKAKQFDYCSDECRVKHKTIEKQCECCGKTFKTIYKDKKCCSRKCSYEKLKKMINQRQKDFKKINYKKSSFKCLECGKEVIKEYGDYRTVFCSLKCSNKHNRRLRRYLKRTNGNGQVDSSISLDKLYTKSNGICAICCKQCDYSDYVVYPDGTIVVGGTYPSIDHMIPLSKGGTHTWDNVQLSHRDCNSSKGNRYTTKENGQIKFF